MKSILLIFALTLCTLSAKAQKPTFDETVNYINEFFNENSTIYFRKGNTNAYSTNFLKAKKDGTVIFIWKGKTSSGEVSELVIGSFNLHKVQSYEYSGVNPNGTARLHLFFDKEKTYNESATFGENLSKEMADKMEKMLKHLTSLSTEKAPF